MTTQTGSDLADKKLGGIGDSGREQLSDTVEHAAATALVVSATAARDPLRSQTSRAVFPLIHSAGDGAGSRRRAGALASLVADVLAGQIDSADMRPALALALERWLLHPHPRTATELKRAVREYVNEADSVDSAVLERAWVVGPGLDDALVKIREHGLNGDDAQPLLSLIATAVELTVPMVWVARTLGVNRDQIYRRIRVIDREAWRSQLP
ncbi:Uncharacterised protein [Mycobacteroides abscessus subsp. abscessus]|uniref:hypothetical protein n=1 Tax=Mycobacteroides abscessus TaxID=36809 RepID=UPI00092A271A|nr:hypothetical protein [Mycobacteroides abscessus]SIM06242.1 Uncharacterised protein [Mycobacteroides abscessus subsp. abscessus]SLC77214.1 Uncharacterised protein [Mycobacteroides abscessus subsp. abscessus]